MSKVKSRTTQIHFTEIQTHSSETQRIIGDLPLLDLLHWISLTSDLLVKSEDEEYTALELPKLRQTPKGVCRVKENNNYSKNNNYSMTGKETGYNKIGNYRRREIIQGCNIMRVQYQERLEGERNKTGHEVLYTLLSFQ